MPDCYHVVSSDPERTANDIVDCFESLDERLRGKGSPEVLRTDEEGKVYSLIHFDDENEAREALDRISECVRKKGHTVEVAVILYHYHERGLTARGYPDDRGSGATSA